MSKEFTDKKNSNDDNIIRNKNRVERRAVNTQPEYERLQVKPMEAGVLLFPPAKKTISSSAHSSLKNDDGATLVAKSSKKTDLPFEVNDPKNFNSNIGSGSFPFNKKLNPSRKEWASLDGEYVWSADDSDTDNVIESNAPIEYIDNNDYVTIDQEDEQSNNMYKSSENEKSFEENTEINNYILLVKNKVLLTNATEDQVQDLIEKIIYGEIEEYQNEDLKSSDFSVLKRVKLNFGVSILG